MQCKKCSNFFPNRIFIDGKKRNLQNRKYCFDCSPFGKHNTLKLDCVSKTIKCKVCDRVLKKGKEKGYCWSCAAKKHKAKKVLKIQQLVGTACWICGYSKHWNCLDFHHVYPENKEFNLSVNEMQYAWDRLEKEVKKCVLLCCRCHREVHVNIVSREEIVKLWENKWHCGVFSTV